MMMPVSRSSITRWLPVAMWLLVAACSGGTRSTQPAIVFTTVPPAGEGGAEKTAPVSGRVTGLRTGQRIVLFTRSGVWWVQPLIEKPFTEIKSDSTWTSSVHLGTEYAALLVEPGYQPPATVESLPEADGTIVAVATAKGTGSYAPPTARTLSFSGYDWEIRQIPSERGGTNEYDARNAWVDADGLLHLTVSQRDGRWTSAEVKLTRSLGYGTYVFVVRDTSQLDPAASLAFFTWDDTADEQNHRELDVELGRWGDPENKDAQYVVQPHFVAANVFRFRAPSTLLTHSFRWEPGRAAFKTVVGRSPPVATVVAQREFTSGIPVSGAETVRIDLYYFRGAPKPPGGKVEVVVEKFLYLP